MIQHIREKGSTEEMSWWHKTSKYAEFSDAIEVLQVPPDVHGGCWADEDIFLILFSVSRYTFENA